MTTIRRLVILVSAMSVVAMFAGVAHAAARRIGILMPYPADDRVVQARVKAFKDTLTRLGWPDQAVAFDERWTTDDLGRVRSEAEDLINARVDVILTTGSRVMPILKSLTSTVPIVFAGNSDPVGQGLVASLARPGGNITGFSLLEFTDGRSPLIGKLVEIARQLRPAFKRAALIFNSDNPATVIHRATFIELGRRLGFEAAIFPVRSSDDIVDAIARFSASEGEIVVMPSDLTLLRHRRLIVEKIAKARLTAIYSDPSFVAIGGLAAYSADRDELFRRAAGYVDRILKGSKVAEMPVQQPTRYQLVVNLKTAKTLGLTIPPSILIRADEVIE